MLRDFARDTALYGAATLLVRGISLLLLPFYTRVLSPTDYGVVDLATVFMSLVLLTVALEVSQGVARLFPDADDHAERVGYASTALWFSIGAYALFVAIALPLAPELSRIVFDSRDRADVATVMVLSAAANGVFLLLLHQLRWSLKPVGFTAGSLTYALTSIGATVALVLAADLGVTGVLLGQLVGAIGGALVSLAFSRELYRLTFDRRKLAEMLRFSLPLVPSSIGVFVTLYIDRVAIKELMTVADVGIFGIGYRVASVVTLLVIGVQLAVTPLIYSRYREPGAPMAIAQIFRAFVGMSVVVAVALSIFASEILRLVTTPEFYAGAVVVPLLGPALLISAMYVFAPGLGIAKRSGLQALIMIAGAALNTVLNFVLIPPWGIIGAAAGTLVSAVVVLAIYMMVSQRLYPVPHTWRPMAGAAAAGALACAAGLSLSALALPTAVAVLLKLLLLLGIIAVVMRLDLVDSAALLRRLRPSAEGSPDAR